MIERLFPNLKPWDYKVTSSKDFRYNCFAFTLDDTKRIWDPVPYADKYWPPGIPREPLLKAVLAMYSSFGYSICSSGEIETGFQKVAIYVKDGQPKHAAKQLTNGRWASKIGPHVDFEHPLDPLNGGWYGNVEYILRKPIDDNTKILPINSIKIH